MGKQNIEGFFLGVDVGTQGTKSVLCSGQTGEVMGSAREEYPLIEKTDGTREQDPAHWIKAVKNTIKSVLLSTGVDKALVKAIGVSGQQHGFVPLDGGDSVIRNAKLWNDTSTEEQCRTILERLGGERKAIEFSGNNILPGYTAPKVLWLKEKEPENYKKLSTILLPHDYINLYLTGNKTMEAGDSSGTAFFDVKKKIWAKDVLEAIDSENDLTGFLPQVIDSMAPAGFVRKEVLVELGFFPNSKIIVSSGGGDNMMGAIGTGNTRPGIVTVSLGTSGTIYAFSEFPVVDSRGEFAAFCDSTGGWLPLACTMNVTVATELVKNLFSLDNRELDAVIEEAPVGSGGLVLLPYFVGERTPNVPSGTGVYFGINEFTLKTGYISRAAMEGVTLGMRYGLESMTGEGIKPSDIRLTGGGSKSSVWQQISADIFNVQTVTMEIDEAAGFGAAIQAMWCYSNYNGQKVKVSDLTDSFVKLKEEERKKPQKGPAEIYDELFNVQNEVSSALRKAFDLHRKIVSKN
jgi:xylulokinase